MRKRKITSKETKTMLTYLKDFYQAIRDFLLLILTIILIYQNFTFLKEIPSKVKSYFTKQNKETTDDEKKNN